VRLLTRLELVLTNLAFFRSRGLLELAWRKARTAVVKFECCWAAVSTIFQIGRFQCPERVIEELISSKLPLSMRRSMSLGCHAEPVVSHTTILNRRRLADNTWHHRRVGCLRFRKSRCPLYLGWLFHQCVDLCSI
jgi:hypothetical protein